MGYPIQGQINQNTIITIIISTDSTHELGNLDITLLEFGITSSTS